ETCAMRPHLLPPVLLVAGCAGTTSPQPTISIDPLVSAGVPGALLLIRDAGQTQTATAGLADVDARAKGRPSSRFRIGSVTKTLVATVVLQLAAERHLRLDDPVSRWLPGLLPDGARISIRDLLDHRSGLPDVADDPSVLHGARSNWPPRRLVALMARQPRT